MKSKGRGALSFVLALTMFFSLFQPINLKAETISNTSTFEYDGFTVDYTIQNSWDDSQTIEVKITNTGVESIENWALKYNQNGVIEKIWNAQIMDPADKTYVFKNAGYNAVIEPGQSVTFGYTLTKVTGAPTFFEMIQYRTLLNEVEYSVSVRLNKDWNYGFNGDIIIQNNTSEPIEYWELLMKSNFTITSIWGADVVQDADGYYILKSTYISVIPANESITIGFNGTKSEVAQIEYSELTEVILGYREDGIFEKILTDELGNTYEMSWYSENDVTPTITKYTDIPLNQLIDTTHRKSVSTLGAIQFNLTGIEGLTQVTTKFQEVPDMILKMEIEEKTAKWLPFTVLDDDRVSFYLDESSIIIPVVCSGYMVEEEVVEEQEDAFEDSDDENDTNIVPEENTEDAQTDIIMESETTVYESSVVFEGDINIESFEFVEFSHPQYYAANDSSDDYVKMFNIISNSNGKIEVELTDINNNWSKWCEKFGERDPEVFVIIKDLKSGKTTRIDLPDKNCRFTFTSDVSSTYEIAVLEEDVIFNDKIWVQDVFLQKKPTLSEQQITQLASKYSPILLYTGNEKYAPMDLNDLFDRVERKFSNKEIKISLPGILNDTKVKGQYLKEFMSYNGHKDYLFNITDAKENANGPNFADITGDFNNATIYYSFLEDDDYYYVNYHFIYAYDTKNKPNEKGSHNFDRESMTIVFNKSLQPQKVVTSGHILTSKMQYLDSSNKAVQSWTNGRVYVDYADCISPYSDGRPIIAVAEGSHALFPVSGNYKATNNYENAGIVTNILSGDGSLSKTGYKALFPNDIAINVNGERTYTLKNLGLDKMYGMNPLNFSGYWVDLLNADNCKFPPFTEDKREFDVTGWCKNAVKFNMSDSKLTPTTKRAIEQFNNGYLFSRTTVKQFSATSASNGIKLQWQSLTGVKSYTIKRTDKSTQATKTFTVEGYVNTYTDTTAVDNATYDYSITATYTVNGSRYGSNNINVTNIPAYVSNVKKTASAGTGKLNIRIRDAVTNQPLTGVAIYVDDKLVMTTTSGEFSIDVTAGTTHKITASKNGYTTVNYNEIVVEKGKTIDLDTVMQVPKNDAKPNGDAQLLVLNATDKSNVAGATIEVRQGMNTTTGTLVGTYTTDSEGKVKISSLKSGNYTGVIKKNGYINTLFNFVVIGGETRSYELHFSPLLNDNEIRIVLSWGQNPRDLDAHLLNGAIHVYFNNKTVQGIMLDVDDTSSYGPETITIKLDQAQAGVYQYYVKHYAGSGNIATSGTVVKVYRGDTCIKTYYAPSTATTAIWNVFKIDTSTGEIIDY